MKNPTNLILLSFLLISAGCAQEDTSSFCEKSCPDEEFVETLNHVEAKVIKFYDDGFILTINPDDFESQFFVHATDEFILVPCNWNSSFSDNTRVIISGKKMNCCRLLTFPNERRGFGCKFEITSIELLTDK